LIPKSFLAEYKCENCGETYVMTNCLVPWFQTWCEECESISTFRSLRLEHKGWEWDVVED
jgi:predicted nucleic acid-binding Zn ribbon protein